MAGYELRVAPRRPARLRGSHTWHVVLRGDGEALRGRDLDGGAPEVRPIGEARLVIQRFRCHLCFQRYQEQVRARVSS
jgi:hypothetical protein